MSMIHDIVHMALIDVTDRHTIHNYKSDIAKFLNWAKDNGITRMKDLKGKRIEILNDYSSHLQDRGLASSTIHTYLAPVCKGLQVDMKQIEKPIRRSGEITKRRLDSANLRGRRERETDRYARSVKLSEATGVRKAELIKLTYRDLMAIDESGYRCVAVFGGKGGKHTLQRLNPVQEALCDQFIAQAINSGENLDDRILKKGEVSEHIAYHSDRANRAQEAYKEYVDRIKREGNGKLIKELVDRWNSFNKADKDKIIIEADGSIRTNPKSRANDFVKSIRDADKPYTLRGDNRLRALASGKPLVYNRLALLAVSVFDLSHWRINVTVSNYML